MQTVTIQDGIFPWILQPTHNPIGRMHGLKRALYQAVASHVRFEYDHPFPNSTQLFQSVFVVVVIVSFSEMEGRVQKSTRLAARL